MVKRSQKPACLQMKQFTFAARPIVQLEMETIVEGNPIQITCKTARGRPAPDLVFKLGDKIVDRATKTLHYFDNATELYHSNATLTSADRNWNGRQLQCCASNKWYSGDICSNRISVKYECK